MSELDRHRSDRTAREYEETDDAFAQVRTAMVTRLLSSPLDAAGERERLYLAVQVLDLVRTRMTTLISSASDSKAIEAYATAIQSGHAQI
jgi:hypothetical protein